MLKNIFYINLEHRTDRKAHVESELAKMGWTDYTRFNAIKLHDGRVGCSMSHLKILKMAREMDLDYVTIIEDDIEFTNPEKYKLMLKAFFKKNLDYDVFLLAGNIRKPITKVDGFAYRVQKSFTTTGYVVKKHYYDKLITNIENGIAQLLKYPDKHGHFAIDTYWMNLQKVDIWLILIPRTVTQYTDYSDIEEKDVNYSRLMLDNMNDRNLKMHFS